MIIELTIYDLKGELTNNINLEFPFLVGLTTSDIADDNLTVCTGTLVSSIFVLSSAHCTSRFKAGIKVGKKRDQITDILQKIAVRLD